MYIYINSLKVNTLLIEMIKEKIHWGTITYTDLKNAVTFTPDKVFMITAGLKEYEKTQILDIANNNRVAN